MSDEVLDRLNSRARWVVDRAEDEARRLRHSHIGTEHILLGLIHQDEGIAVEVLGNLGISLDAVRQQVEEIIGQGQQASSGPIPFTPQAKDALELSRREALRLRHENIGTEHLLLGLIREGKGAAAQVLTKLGADQSRVRDQAIQLRRNGKRPKTPQAQPTDSTVLVVEHFGQNLTRRAIEGRLGPVVGRDQEIKRVIDVLSQRTMNNPVLVGGTSAGRTAVLEGVAQKIAKGEVPAAIKNKQLYAIDPDTLAAGGQAANIQGAQLRIRILELIARLDLRAYEETVSSTRLEQKPVNPGAAAAQDAGKSGPATRAVREPYWKISNLDVVAAVLEECRAADNIILFIDELPKWTGASEPGSAIYLTPILTPMLTSGELQIVGAGTAGEYRRSEDKDKVLSPWLRPVHVTEPTITYTIGMLKLAQRAATQASIPAD